MFKLTKTIIQRTEIPYEKVLSTLYSGISTGYSYNLFPDKIMTGRINSGKIQAVINPPKGWSDPFKSRVKGYIKKDKKETHIEMKISLSWVIIAFYIIWYSIMLFLFLSLFFSKNSDKSASAFSLLIVFVLFLLGLGKLKLNWDKSRLEEWIKWKIKKYPYD